MTNPRSLIALLFAVACSTGGSYPEDYATEFCRSAYACIGAEAVEAITLWDDEAECREETTDIVQNDPGFEGWEEGDCAFDAEAAVACIDEVAEIRVDSDCDGEMGYLAFLGDSLNEQCGQVYDCD